MARQRKPQFETETVQAVAAGVCEDLDPEHGPDGGHWFVREGSVWKADHRIVRLQPEWFVEFGTAEISPKYHPAREPTT